MQNKVLELMTPLHTSRAFDSDSFGCNILSNSNRCCRLLHCLQTCL